MKYIVPPTATTWAPVPEDSHFPIQNLPFCRFEEPELGEIHLGVRIGDQLLSIDSLIEHGFLGEYSDRVFLDIADLANPNEPTALGIGPDLPALPTGLSDLRRQIAELLDADNPELRDNAEATEGAFFDAEAATFEVPTFCSAFVDFYSGIHHASNVGRMFRPTQPPLLPNYRHVPIAYNGKASTVFVSGTGIVRPKGQYLPAGADAPVYGACQELDFELEMGFYIAQASVPWQPVQAGEAEEHILGLVLVNDWSARDLQRWEYQPLGPFLSKSFSTSASPYLVTLDALEPFRIQGMPQDPAPLPHLRTTGAHHFDIQLEVLLQTPAMSRPQVISRSNTKHLYWSMAQQIAHLTSNGAPLTSGDLCASGTISGEEEGTFGSLLELTWKGERPLTMKETGETRTFLEDGDRVILTGWGKGQGYRVGFGSVEGVVLPAR